MTFVIFRAQRILFAVLDIFIQEAGNQTGAGHRTMRQFDNPQQLDGPPTLTLNRGVFS